MTFILDDSAGLLEDLTIIVLRAGATILREREAGLSPRRKPDGSPVTVADEASEALIMEALSRRLPGLPLVSEESAARAGLSPDAREFMLIDPLDGTREIIAGRDEFVINLALIREGVPVLGVVAAPALGFVWRGVSGKGAERLRFNPADATEQMSAPEQIRTRRWPQKPVAMLSRTHLEAVSEAFAIRMQAEKVRCGSAMKFCRIAEGDADLYPRLSATCEWDIAAGHAVLAAAGGIVTTRDGDPLTYGHAARRFYVPNFVAWGDPVHPADPDAR